MLTRALKRMLTWDFIKVLLAEDVTLEKQRWRFTERFGGPHLSCDLWASAPNVIIEKSARGLRIIYRLQCYQVNLTLSWKLWSTEEM